MNECHVQTYFYPCHDDAAREAIDFYSRCMARCDLVCFERAADQVTITTLGNAYIDWADTEVATYVSAFLSLDRTLMIDLLATDDRNGVYRDEDCRAEGLQPMTLHETRLMILSVIDQLSALKITNDDPRKPDAPATTSVWYVGV